MTVGSYTTFITTKQVFFWQLCLTLDVKSCLLIHQLNEEPLAMNQDSSSQDLVPLKNRRTRIPDKPNYSLNLWSIMKNCIGKELSKIPMPVGVLTHTITKLLVFLAYCSKRGCSCQLSNSPVCLMISVSLTANGVLLRYHYIIGVSVPLLDCDVSIPFHLQLRTGLPVNILMLQILDDTEGKNERWAAAKL